MRTLQPKLGAGGRQLRLWGKRKTITSNSSPHDTLNHLIIQTVQWIWGLKENQGENITIIVKWKCKNVLDFISCKTSDKKKKGETTLNGMPLIINTCLIGWKTFINI